MSFEHQQAAPVQATEGTASAAVTTTPCYVRGIYVRGAATAGTLVLKDGGSSGSTLCTIDTPAQTTSGTFAGIYIPLPGVGMKFSTSCYATLTTATAFTVFYSQAIS